jgi:hypothetical protein
MGTDRPIVYLPTNMESAADNSLAIAAVSAINSLGAAVEFATTKTEVDWAQLDKKVGMYLAGVSWGLNHKVNGKGSLQPFSQVSGPMGHGFYWVAHTAMQNQYGSSFWAKGTGWHMTKGLTGKAWDNTLSSTQTRIIALCSRAARSLNCSENWHSWFRAKESFLGSELKKSLPHMRVGIITQPESNYLATRFAASIQQYNSAKAMLDSPTEESLRTLGDVLKNAGQSLQSLELTVNRVIQLRVSVLYPTNKKEKKAALKRPIVDLIGELDTIDQLERFDPALLGGYKPFYVESRLANEDVMTYRTRLRAAYERRLQLIRNGGDVPLTTLCTLWADEVICPMIVV